MKQKFMFVLAFALFGAVALANENVESNGDSFESSGESNVEMLESNGESLESAESVANFSDSAESNAKSLESTAFIETSDFEDIYIEQDGAFVGVGIGYGMLNWQLSHYRWEKGSANNFDKNTDKNAFGVSYDFIAGYKHFFNPYLGARYYASFGAYHGALKAEGFSRVDMIDYGVNADFLANVYANANLNFGLFFGLGIGGNTIVGKYVSDVKRDLSDKIAGDSRLCNNGCVNIKTKATHFDFAINAGLRLNIGAHHGLELAVRVPLLSKTIYSWGVSVIDTVGGNGTDKDNLELKYSTNLFNAIKPSHSIKLRYVYSF